MAFAYSEEQQAIIESSPLEHRKVVAAFSGCGKSTVLIGFSNERLKQGKSCLYISFNKSIANEAKRKFPKQVECRTMNGLAFQAVGKEFQERLTDKVSSTDFLHLFKDLSIREDDKLALCHHSLRTFERWCNSAERSPTAEHIGSESMDSLYMGFYDAGMIIDGAIRIFQEMLSGEGPVSHSLYMKLYQLERPKINFDVIMVDEAQDLNPVVISILEEQHHAEIIRVGDRHQSIYEFRGAVDGMYDPDAALYHLTQTYRFGQNLADKATAILKNHKNEPLPLIGKGSSVLIDEYEEPAMDQYISNPLYIARTAAGVMEILADVLLNYDPSRDAPAVYMPGGYKSYGFSNLIDAWNLFSKGIGGGSYHIYKSWRHYQEVSELTGCQNAQTTIRLVTRYKGAIMRMLQELKKCSVTSPRKATISLTTGHKSKGLEAPFVVLAEDFPNFNNPDLPLLSEQEVNLAYVAVTRAQKAIHLSGSIRELIASEEVARLG